MTEPFKRDEFIDKDGIVGARWWHEGLVSADPLSRRNALKALLVGGGILAAGIAISKSCKSSGDETTTVSRNALEMQKEYGWNFGAATEYPTFDGTTVQPFDPAQVPKLATDLAPAQASLRPYFVPTLLQSITAVPTSSPPGDPAPFVPLTTAVRPIRTTAMDVAYRAGQALASLFDTGVPGVAVVVDLPGPESIAFAAGAASVFDPVFAIDNWPHPRGVVPAPLSLAAAHDYQPLFAKAAAARRSPHPAAPVAPPPSSGRPATSAAPRPPSAPPALSSASPPLPAAPHVPPPPMFVLDRNRLSPYTDESSQFDNRHLARLPPVGGLKSLGVTRVLYVVPRDVDLPEMEDLNSAFLGASMFHVTVKVVGANAFAPDTSPSGSAANPDAAYVYYYGGSAATHGAFWADYPWTIPPRPGIHPPNISTLGKDYVPTVRLAPLGAAPRPALGSPGAPPFGMVPVVVATATGAILGAAISRSGSWNRSSGGWGGG